MDPFEREARDVTSNDCVGGSSHVNPDVPKDVKSNCGAQAEITPEVIAPDGLTRKKRKEREVAHRANGATVQMTNAPEMESLHGESAMHSLRVFNCLQGARIFRVGQLLKKQTQIGPADGKAGSSVLNNLNNIARRIIPRSDNL